MYAFNILDLCGFLLAKKLYTTNKTIIQKDKECLYKIKNNNNIVSVNVKKRFFDGDDKCVYLKHSINDYPAKILLMYINNKYSVCELCWYTYGILYREKNPTLPAKIDFYANGRVRCEYYCNTDGKLHSYNGNPAYVSYFYGDNHNNERSEERWYENGVLIKRIEY